MYVYGFHAQFNTNIVNMNTDHFSLTAIHPKFIAYILSKICTSFVQLPIFILTSSFLVLCHIIEFAIKNTFSLLLNCKFVNHTSSVTEALINLIYVTSMSFVFHVERETEFNWKKRRRKKKQFTGAILVDGRIRIGSELIVYAWRIVKVTRDSKMILQIGHRTVQWVNSQKDKHKKNEQTKNKRRIAEISTKMV